MGTTLTIALRYLTARREGAGLSLVPLLSGLGIMIGAATLVVVMAVFEGYRTAVLDRLLAQTGHLVITKPGFRSFDPTPAQAVVTAQTGVARSQPVLITQGLILRGEKGAGVVVQAMDLSDMRADPVLAEAAGHFDALSPSDASAGGANAASGLSPVVLGAGLAAELGLTRGDSLRLVLSADSSDRAQGTTAASSFGLVYAGAFSAGLFEVDQSGALALLADAQGWQTRAGESYGSDTVQTPGEVSEIRLMLNDLSQRRQVLPRIRSRLPETLLISDRASDLFRDYDWVRAQGNAATLIVIVILIVAAFGVASGQLMMVQERRADIAILRGFGVQPGGVLRVFLLAGLLVAVIGLGLGLALGWYISVSLNEIRLALEAVIGRPLFNAAFYQIDEIRGDVRASGLVFVSAVTLCVSFLATLYPAWRASQVPPALALKEV
ncbi:MAG TPA: hypothetical protein DFJ59_02955 [Alphaproteobacteria bacterium]|nr:hypothetical protein [Alphaproteobacteria bacterium]